MVQLRLSTCCGLLLLVGCSSSQSPLVPVQGVVHYRGRPLAGGTIVFSPDKQRGGRGPLAWAKIAYDGNFTLTTSDQPGISPGWYRITVAGSSVMELPGRYYDPETSGQCFEVPAKGAPRCHLDLE